MDEFDNSHLVEVMRREGAASYPREACGVVIAVGRKYEVVTCRNVAQRDDQFMIHHEDLHAALSRGELIAVWHTHCDLPPTPSQADLAGVEATGVSWFIMSVRKGEGGQFEFEGPTVHVPKGLQIPYTERPYVPGAFDCYSLVRDYYRNEFGVHLGDYPRVLADGSPGEVVFAQKFAAEGFVPVDPAAPKVGDLLLIALPGQSVPTHSALYIGNDQILHHCRGRLSRREQYFGYWQRHTTHHLRHKSQC